MHPEHDSLDILSLLMASTVEKSGFKKSHILRLKVYERGMFPEYEGLGIVEGWAIDPRENDPYFWEELRYERTTPLTPDFGRQFFRVKPIELPLFGKNFSIEFPGIAIMPLYDAWLEFISPQESERRYQKAIAAQEELDTIILKYANREEILSYQGEGNNSILMVLVPDKHSDTGCSRHFIFRSDLKKNVEVLLSDYCFAILGGDSNITESKRLALLLKSGIFPQDFNTKSLERIISYQFGEEIFPYIMRSIKGDEYASSNEMVFINTNTVQETPHSEVTVYA